MKRIIALTLVVLLIAVTGCAKAIPAASKDLYVKKSVIAEAGDWFNRITSIAKTPDGFIMSGSRYIFHEGLDNTDYSNENFIATMDNDGKLLNKRVLESATEENGYSSEYYSDFLTDSNGVVFAMERVSSNEDGNWIDKNYLSKINPDLTSEQVLDFNKAFEGVVTDPYLHFMSMALDDFGNVFVNYNMQVYGINIASGKIFYTQLQGDYYTQGVTRMDDGKAGVMVVKFNDTESSNVIIPIDPTTGAEGAEIIFPVSNDISRSDFDSEYSYYYADFQGIHGFSEGDEEQTLVADMMKSGIAHINFGGSKPICISPDSFAMIGTDTLTAKETLFLLTIIPPDEVPDKKLISMAGMGADDYVSSYIKKFNAENEEFQIDYKVYSIGSDVTNYMSEFTADILAGKTFDIMDVNIYMPYASYAKKGLFTDLNEYIDNDPELKREDLVESVLEASEIDGKLYSLATGYDVYSLVGKTAIFGDKPGISLDKILEISKNYPEAAIFDRATTRDGFLSNILYYSFTDYVDYQNGTTRFNTPEFITLLETSMDYPEQIDYNNYDWSEAEGLYSKDLALLRHSSLRDFQQAKTDELTFGEPITFLGFPNSKGESGIVAMPRYEYAIMKNTPNPDGAWQFIKGISAYEGELPVGNVQYISDTLSILRSKNDVIAKEATEPQYYYDANGVKQFITGSYSMYIGGVDVEIKPNTPEDNEMTYKAIDNVSEIYRYGANIWTIILEETTPYFKGGKSAKETAEMIDNRVMTYLQETM
jgi:ABC-type glycerol-3-phosphate transport system substrate-binding protein